MRELAGAQARPLPHVATSDATRIDSKGRVAFTVEGKLPREPIDKRIRRREEFLIADMKSVVP
jgi:hypothetical protein